MLNYQRFIIYSFASISLLIGLIFGENSSGGAKIDFEFFQPYLESFTSDFVLGFNSYLNNAGSIIHSPVFYILVSLLNKITNEIYLIRIFYIILCCSFPYLFYLILKDKFKINTNILFLFSLIIFLSPYFRSSAIWLGGDNLSLIFFGLSIYFFNKIYELKKDNFVNYFLCMFFLILCCYIRYYYCIFSLYYLFFFFKRMSLKSFFLLIAISLLLSFPAIFYFIYIFINLNFLNTVTNYSQINFYSNSLTILSILSFYLLPLCCLQLNLFKKYLIKNKKIISTFFTLIFCMYFLNLFFFENLINFSPRGGGVFMKISELIKVQSSLFLSLISFFSLIMIDYFFKEKRLQNYSLLIILILSFPIYTIFQKYFDPLFFIFFFGLIQSNSLKIILLDYKKFLTINYGFFTFFYLFALFYYKTGI